MNRISIFIMLVISSMSAFAQKQDVKFPINTETGKIYFSDVVEVKDKSKDDLFISANTWFANTFNSSKDVIQYSDKDKGIIIGKGLIEARWGYINFTFTVKIKDNKYKYEVDNIFYEIKAEKENVLSTHGDLTKDKSSDSSWKKMPSKHWKKEKKTAYDRINKLIDSLNSEMLKQSISNEDW